MTKSSPRKLATRSRPKRNEGRPVDTFKPKRDISRRKFNKSVVGILDFKKQHTHTVYLVQREDNMDGAWEDESSIEAKDMLSDYQKKVQDQSGYSFQDNSQGRSSRLSKVRAVMALKNTEFALDSFNDDNEIKGGTKRKKLSGGSQNKTKKGRSTGIRKTKAAVELETKMEERRIRKAQRETIDAELIMRDMKGKDARDCCLACANRCYNECIKMDNVERFRVILDDVEHAPAPSSSSYDINELPTLGYSVALGRTHFSKLIKEKEKALNAESIKRPEIPLKHIQQDFNTGSNYGRGVYGNMAFRQVQISRGNRQGDAAFYPDPENYKFQSDLDYQLPTSKIIAYMPYITEHIFREPQAIEGYRDYVYSESGPNDIYHAVLVGSRRLGCQLMQTSLYGRAPFNGLHVQTLNYTNGKPLESYRKPQILKGAFEAKGLTPFHCAAINPSRIYLQEFFEVLDSADRLKADNCGRTVIFYAAASETSDCLEYLISQGVSLTQMDKYRVTPLVHATRCGRAHNVEIIIKHLMEGKKDDEDSSSIFQSIIRNKKTVLHVAAFLGHVETCRILIKYGCPVDSVEVMDKKTALMYAAKNGHLECVRLLIEEGNADPEKADKYMKNSLHMASIGGSFEVVKYLLSKGIDANSPDSSQNRPVHYAAAFGYLEILHLLIHYGQANPGLSSVWRTTPCSIANVKGHVAIVKYLLGFPRDLINVDFKNDEGLTMLHYTVTEPASSVQDQLSSLKKAELLISMNANVNTVDIYGDSCLHSIAKNISYIEALPRFYESFYPDIRRKNSSNYYSNQKPNRNFEDDDQDGILYLENLGKLLISHNADIHIRNQDGETPLASAMRSNNHPIVILLIQSGAKYWKDLDKKGSNFVHYVTRLLAYIDQLQPHREIDQVQKDRFVLYADTFFKLLKEYKPEGDELRLLANKANNDGYPPIVYGVNKAITMQKKAMAREKSMVREYLEYSYPYSSQYRSKYNVEEEEARKHEVDLNFSFIYWMKYMDIFIQEFGCNLNTTVVLPKDFKKKNPDVKKSQYPKYTGYGALHFAAQTQSYDLIRFLLYNGCDANLKVNDIQGNTAMIIAYHKKRDKFQEVPDDKMETTEEISKRFNLKKPDFTYMLRKTIEVFIEYKASPYTISANGHSPAMNAAINMDVSNLKEMCKAVSFDESNINSMNDLGQTLLMIIINKISELIKKNEDFDIDIIKHLLCSKADPNVQYPDKNTIFMKAVKTSYAPLVDTILENTQVNSENILSLVCALNNDLIIEKYIALLKKSQNSISAILNTCGVTGKSPLSFSATNGNLKTTKALLELGADPNFYNIGVFPLVQAVRSKNIEVVKLLLDSGADVTYKTLKGNTALHIAVHIEKHQIVKLLLEYGADCNSINNSQKTPIHFAIEATKKQKNRSFRVERLLIQAGANLAAKDNFGRMPLHYAFVKMDFVPLNRHTAVVSKKLQKISREIKHEKKITEELLNFTNKYSLDPSTTLDSWLEAGKRKQLEQKSNEEKSEYDVTEDMEISKEEKESLKEYNQCKFEEESERHERFDPIDIVKYLTDHNGVDYEAQDKFGRTPLHYAACVGAFSCTTLLIGKNINIDTVDADHNGALQLSLQNGHVDYAVMLCNTGASFKNKVTMKNGKEASTFGYSLSISVINLAYLIMERGINPLESVQDSLTNGKFHMVELLLKSAQNESLSGVLEDKNQNLWHIVSDFKPFDDEIWQEYLDEIITRIAPLNLGVFPDIFMRTPLHYAAKHGQTKLLEYLLKTEKINIYDSDGKSELYYAVESGNIENVQMLINAGANVNGQKEPRDESMLLKAVKANQIDIVRLLLNHGVNTDDDSQYGRPNAVMAACDNENVPILKLLIDAKSNLDTPSHIERKNSNGKKIRVLVSPIFIASSKEDKSIFKTLLASEININVYGPDCYPEYGRSLFMFNVFLDKVNNQKALLEKKVDLNMLDGPNNQSIFYQFLFNQLGVFKNSKGEETKRPHPKFKDFIFNQMMKDLNLQVSLVDEKSGATPLELAISEDNHTIVERLLLLSADPNVESCYVNPKPGFSSFIKMSQIKVPVILHAILQNNPKIFTIICQQTKVPINWLWHDSQKRNILSYIFGAVNGYSNEDVSLLEYLRSAMGEEVFHKALNMVDAQNNNPVYYAFQRSIKAMYERLEQLEPTVKNMKLIAQSNEVPDETMKVDTITMTQIDEDAQIERELLQKEQDAQKKNDSSSEKIDTKAKVDVYSKLEKVGHVESDNSDEPYDIMLLKVELIDYIGTQISFYKMSIIRNRLLDLYVLWTRWGSFGDEGQHQSTPYLTKEEAVSEFKSIFRSKSGNVWEERSSFQPKAGKYEILGGSQHPSDTILKNFDFMASSTPSGLPDGVFNIMKLICNYQYLSRVYKDTSIAMPIGQMPQKRIEQAFKILKEAKEINDKLYSTETQHSRESAHIYKTCLFELGQKCIEYTRLVPHTGEANGLVRSLLNYKNVYSCKVSFYENELANLLDLSYVSFAANVMLAAKHCMEKVSPLDYAYRALNCSLKELNGNETEYSMIKSYMESTSDNYELINVFSVERDDEQTRFSHFENSPNRMLLWHGSKIGNFMGILKQGLRGAPNTTANNGALLGTGVYFADNFSKSIGYCQDYYMSNTSPYSIMLLCEVALGRMQVFKNYDDVADPEKFDSIQALGERIPSPFNSVFDERGNRIPFGPTIKNNTLEYEGNTIGLNNNEYMVHDENRVKIRYLLIIKNTSVCGLCSQTKDDKEIKSFKSYEFKDYKFSQFNDYEKEIVKSYVIHQKQSLKEIFDSHIEKYVKNGEYKKKWDVPLDINLESKVCTSCSEYSLAMILERIITSGDCSVDIPDNISQKPTCHYGRECRTQNKTFHAKKFQHWLKDKKFEDIKQAEIEHPQPDSFDDSEESDSSMDVDDE